MIQQLIKWEDLNAEEYLRELDRDERETLEYRVKQAEKNTSDILNAIVDPMTGEERGSLAERVSHLESQVRSSNHPSIHVFLIGAFLKIRLLH